jgi:hypothetical protein
MELAQLTRAGPYVRPRPFTAAHTNQSARGDSVTSHLHRAMTAAAQRRQKGMSLLNDSAALHGMPMERVMFCWQFRSPKIAMLLVL